MTGYAPYLGKSACALVLDFVVAQVQLGQLVVGVLLQRARQLRCACTPRNYVLLPAAQGRHPALLCEQRSGAPLQHAGRLPCKHAAVYI